MASKKNYFSVPGTQDVTYKLAGDGALFTDPDVDEARQVFRQKDRKLISKVTTLKDAVSNLINDGDYLGIGGFGSNRIPTAVLHEIVRQRKKELSFAGHTSTHDCQILIAGETVTRCDIAYVVGLEARGLSSLARKAFQSGQIEATEWTNAALAWRYKAAAMGVSFLPVRSMLGTDTMKYSASIEMPCPFTGKKYLAVPALYPDVGIIHVHRCDVYGNAQIEGITVSDPDLARASKKLIITTESIVPNEEIRRNPERTTIPYFLVDAVVEMPYGAYPANMANEYFSDEDHIKKWLQVEKDPEDLAEFLQENIYKTKDHYEYLQLNGGLKRMLELRALENMVAKEKQKKATGGANYGL